MKGIKDKYTIISFLKLAATLLNQNKMNRGENNRKNTISLSLNFTPIKKHAICRMTTIKTCKAERIYKGFTFNIYF